jgi:hypothetical protein
LGAADRAPLRGGAREAALDRGDVRASERCRWLTERASESIGRMARESGSFQGRVELRASELDGWIRNRHAPNARAWRDRPIQPAPSRVHDGRCPSRSGWGKALSTSDREEMRRMAKAAWPLARETSTGVASDRYGPWSVAIPVLACGPPGETRHHPGSEHEGNLLNATGDQAIGGTCSRIVLVAEVDERRLAHAERIPMRHAGV